MVAESFAIVGLRLFAAIRKNSQKQKDSTMDNKVIAAILTLGVVGTGNSTDVDYVISRYELMLDALNHKGQK